VHLLVVTSLFPTADRPEVGPFVAQRVDWLRKTGHNVTVVAAADYRAGGFRRHISMLRQVVSGRSVAIDGVEGHVLFPAGAIAALAARVHRVPLVLYAHGSDVAISATRSPVHRVLASRVARRAQAVITNSHDTAVLVDRLGVQAMVVPPGVDFDRFSPGGGASNRAKLGLPNGARVALFLGRLDRGKGADLFAEGVSNSPGWIGVCVGDGPLAPGLRQAWPSIRYVAAVPPEDVPGWLRSADVVIVPSRRESLGLAAVEALACGVPVIAARVGGLMEIVVDGVNGRLVPPDDPSSITAVLRDMSPDAIRAELAREARGSVREHDIRLTTERMAEIWRAVGVAR
jgi:glycosyltransferase involved in cell wall biosynthesis